MGMTWVGPQSLCLVCRQPSFLTVHRKCSRRISTARAGGGMASTLARGAGLALSAETNPAISSTVAGAVTSWPEPPRGGRASSGQSMSGCDELPDATPNPRRLTRTH